MRTVFDLLYDACAIPYHVAILTQVYHGSCAVLKTAQQTYGNFIPKSQTEGILCKQNLLKVQKKEKKRDRKSDFILYY